MGNRYRLLLGLLLLSCRLTIAQIRIAPPTGCAVPELTIAQRKTLEQKATFALRMKLAQNSAFTTITYVPIRPHILRRSDGTGGMSLASINQVIASTNSYYLLNGYGIQFYFAGTAPDYVDNDQQYNSFNDEELVATGHDVTNALNQYYVNAFAVSGLGGYAYYPADSIYSTRSFILNEYWNLDDLGNRLLPHELGHTFNLIHTFGNNNGAGGTTELVTRGPGANCLTDGDLVCDTPADPYNKSGANLITVNGCPQYSPNSTARDANNQLYSPSISNIMSYYFPCTHDFTPGQYDRMQAGLALRQSHTSYSLTYPPTPVAAPGNVVATIVNNQVVITWQDNGTNEMGYFIERSTSPTSDFNLIGGVGPDATTFTDTKTASRTTYYYRIKPSNSTTTGISPTASATTPECHPTYTIGCSYNDGLSGFIFNGVTLSQNSGCSVGGYMSTTATSATVSAGQSYSFTGTLLSSTFPEGVSIWADLNQNNRFETSLGELVYQTPTTVNGQFSGVLSLPGSLPAGPLPIRIVTTYNMIPNDPCGSYGYGETEDYVITIIRPADLSVTLQTNTRTPTINQPVSYYLTIRNDGPFNATGIQWQNRLPPGLAFISGNTGVTGSSTVVNSTGNFALVAGQAITFSYQLQPTQAGIYVNSAQIVSSDQPDPDSQPNSGTGDGQDDQMSIDIRTNAAGGPMYSSPNPNQASLPSVLPNQPTPDPARADLSVALSLNNRTPRLGQPVTLTISVSNMGGLTASTIVVRDTLWGLAFSSSSTGMSVVGSGSGYTIIEGTVSSLSAGFSTQLIFTAMPLLAGYLQNAAQIWSAATADPDSTPGSVTPTANNLNGEDDVAWLDFRVGL